MSNSGPLIHLARVGLIDFLLKLYDIVLIPESVYNEVVIKGKEEGYSDAIIVEQAIVEKRIIVKTVKSENKEVFSFNLHSGELDVIRLALDSKTELVLLDDDEARIIARGLKLKVKGTLGVLIDLVKNRYLGLKDSLRYLKELNSIMYLSSDVYNFVEEMLKKIDAAK